MKHVVTELNDSNEPIIFHNSILGNYNLNTYFENISADVPFLVESYKQSETLQYSQIVKLHYNLVDCSSTNVEVDTNNCLSFSSSEKIENPDLKGNNGEPIAHSQEQRTQSSKLPKYKKPK